MCSNGDLHCTQYSYAMFGHSSGSTPLRIAQQHLTWSATLDFTTFL